jgi:LCP family protein required for cell wall assembly
MQSKLRERVSVNEDACPENQLVALPDLKNRSKALKRCRRFCLRHKLTVTGLSAIAVFVGVGGVFAIACWVRVQRVAVSFPGSAPGGTTYLLVGNDSRSFVQSAYDRRLFGSPTMLTGQHANVVVLVRVRSSGAPEVLSLPRDLLVRLPGGAPVRLTQSFTSGAQTLVNTICHSLGVGVSHLVIIQMNGLRSLVDDVGGITLTVPTPERDLVTGLFLPHAGHIQVNGGEALAYVRARHLQLLVGNRWVPASTSLDERSSRAREVLSLMGAKLAIGPTNPIGSARLIWELSGIVTTDSGMSPFDMDQLGGALKQLHGLQGEQLPVQLHPGPEPTAELEAGGGRLLAQFGTSSSAGCSANLPIVPASGHSSSSLTSIGGKRS